MTKRGPNGRVSHDGNLGALRVMHLSPVATPLILTPLLTTHAVGARHDILNPEHTHTHTIHATNLLELGDFVRSSLGRHPACQWQRAEGHAPPRIEVQKTLVDPGRAGGSGKRQRTMAPREQKQCFPPRVHHSSDFSTGATVLPQPGGVVTRIRDVLVAVAVPLPIKKRPNAPTPNTDLGIGTKGKLRIKLERERSGECKSLSGGSISAERAHQVENIHTRVLHSVGG